MDIPRGTFSSIRRDILLSAILSEIRETSFSGYATVSCGGGSGSFVFSEGACILAEYRGLQGHAAWQEIQVQGGETVEAGIYHLTSQQIRLASEFNKKAVVSVVPPPPQAGRSEGGRNDRAGIPRVKKSPEAAGRLRVPRGTFCEIRRGLSVNEVIDDLRKSGFSGYGLFSGDPGTFTLVFSGGVCILADCGRDLGSAALRQAQTIERLSEVSLYELSDRQISLALEFNEGYGTASAGAVCESGSRRALEDSGVICPSSEPAPHLAAGEQGRQTRRKNDQVSSRMSDLDLLDIGGLDSIDPAAMAADLKSSYVSILSRLDLGHLVDRKEEKERE
jgi:hypothetical protein